MGSQGSSSPTILRLQPGLQEFCRKNRILRLDIFGSVARGEATPASDVDLLVTFAPGTPLGMAHFAFVDRLETELGLLLGCEVDLIEREALEQNPNPLWRKLILSEATELYAAA